MSSMKDREEGFERKFAHDEEVKFKATARRNKLLGLWVAEKLGKTGADADAYAKEVVKSDVEEAGEEDVFRKVAGDLDGGKGRGFGASDPPQDAGADVGGDRADQEHLAAAGHAGPTDRPHCGAVFICGANGFRFEWPRNRFRKIAMTLASRLAAGETLFTAWSGVPDSLIVEIMALAAVRRRHARHAAWRPP